MPKIDLAYICAALFTLIGFDGQADGLSYDPYMRSTALSGELIQIIPTEYGQFTADGIQQLRQGNRVARGTFSALEDVKAECAEPQSAGNTSNSSCCWSGNFHKNLERLKANLKSNGIDPSNMESNINSYSIQQCMYLHMANAIFSHRPIQVCEIGFSAGYSALFWLSASDHVRYFGFGLSSHKYSRLSAKYLQDEFGRKRFKVIFGLTGETISQFMADHPKFICDIFTDGDHPIFGAVEDTINIRDRTLVVTRNHMIGPRSFTYPFRLVLINDVNCRNIHCSRPACGVKTVEEANVTNVVYRQCSTSVPLSPFHSNASMQSIGCKRGFCIYNHVLSNTSEDT